MNDHNINQGGAISSILWFAGRLFLAGQRIDLSGPVPRLHRRDVAASGEVPDKGYAKQLEDEEVDPNHLRARDDVYIDRILEQCGIAKLGHRTAIVHGLRSS